MKHLPTDKSKTLNEAPVAPTEAVAQVQVDFTRGLYTFFSSPTLPPLDQNITPMAAVLPFSHPGFNDGLGANPDPTFKPFA